MKITADYVRNLQLERKIQIERDRMNRLKTLNDRIDILVDNATPDIEKIDMMLRDSIHELPREQQYRVPIAEVSVIPLIGSFIDLPELKTLFILAYTRKQNEWLQKYAPDSKFEFIESGDSDLIISLLITSS